MSFKEQKVLKVRPRNQHEEGYDCLLLCHRTMGALGGYRDIIHLYRRTFQVITTASLAMIIMYLRS